MAKEWFVFFVDHHKGPFSEQEILERLQSKKIGPDSLLWCQGEKGWLPLRSIDPFSANFPVKTEGMSLDAGELPPLPSEESPPWEDSRPGGGSIAVEEVMPPLPEVPDSLPLAGLPGIPYKEIVDGNTQVEIKKPSPQTKKSRHWAKYLSLLLFLFLVLFLIGRVLFLRTA